MSIDLLTHNHIISPKSQYKQTRTAIAEFIANQNSFYTQKAYLYELRQFFQFIKKQDLITITVGASKKKPKGLNIRLLYPRFCIELLRHTYNNR